MFVSDWFISGATGNPNAAFCVGGARFYDILFLRGPG